MAGGAVRNLTTREKMMQRAKQQTMRLESGRVGVKISRLPGVLSQQLVARARNPGGGAKASPGDPIVHERGSSSGRSGEGTMVLGTDGKRSRASESWDVVTFLGRAP